jgi:hypothetical protein
LCGVTWLEFGGLERGCDFLRAVALIAL